MKFIQIRQLKTAVDLIKRSGGINPFLGEPLPLRYCEDGKSRYILMEDRSEINTKKKVSFMGGNFDPVTSHFYKKKKSSAQETIVFDESENEDNNVMIYGLIEGGGWRSDKMDKNDSEDLTKLDDLASEYQRRQWNK